MKKERDFTQGNLFKNILFLGMPIIVANVMETLLNLADMFWVGKLGPGAIAAVAMSGIIMMVIMGSLMGIATGTIAMISRSFGANDRMAASEIALQSLVLALILSTLLGLTGWFFSDNLLLLLGADESVLTLGTGYMKIMFVGVVTMFGSFIIGAILRSTGEAVIPMKLAAISVLANIILDPFLIFGIGFPRMGINGAALATVFSRAISVVWGFLILLRGSARIKLNLEKFSLHPGIMKKLISIGIPSSIQMSLRSLMGLVLMKIVAYYGTLAIAAYGIGLRIQMFVLMPAFSLADATATLVGQNLGVHQTERAQKTAWLATIFDMVIMAFFATIFIVWAPAIIQIFNSNNASLVVTYGANYLRLTSMSYIFMAMGIILSRAMQGAGYALVPMLITLLTLWGIQIPLAILIPRFTDLGLTGVWLAIAVAPVFDAAFTVTLFQHGKWKLHKI